MIRQRNLAGAAPGHRLPVLITFDVELSTGRPFTSPDEFRRNLDSAIYGGPEGRYGLPFQLEMMKRHGLKGVFFVEALSADVVGAPALAEIVALVKSFGQEVQLHVHTEWLRYYPDNTRRKLGLNRDGDNIGDFDRDRQVSVLRHGLDNLHAAGVVDVRAFRAGNFGASVDTLAALSMLGIAFDASYNACFAHAGGICRVAGEGSVHDRAPIAGIVEVPVTCFDDRVFGMRPLQICSVSLAEMRQGLRLAYDARRRTAVIVSHSFELLNRGRTKANPMHVARFVGLCRFLADHRDIMPTVGFADLDPDARGETPVAAPLRSSVLFTLPRVGMQLLGRIYG
jgi:hypothetical protein